MRFYMNYLFLLFYYCVKQCNCYCNNARKWKGMDREGFNRWPMCHFGLRPNFSMALNLGGDQPGLSTNPGPIGDTGALWELAGLALVVFLAGVGTGIWFSNRVRPVRKVPGQQSSAGVPGSSLHPSKEGHITCIPTSWRKHLA